MTLPLKIPPKALNQLANMQTQINTYLQGVLDGMGIEGEFQINQQTGEIKPVQQQPHLQENT